MIPIKRARRQSSARLASPAPRRSRCNEGFRHGLLALTIALLAPVALLAQDEDTGGTITLEGEVLDLVTGVPVVAAIFVIPALGRSAVSDEMGYFRMEDIPAGFYPVQVIRLGYVKLDAEVPINGQEVLALYLTPGPISLEGIEVEVIGREDLDARASGTSSRALIGPLEMEDLRERYFSLNQVLTTRSLPRARYEAPRIPGETGCLMVRTLGFGGGSCAAVVVDGVLLGPGQAGWVYQMSTHDIFAMRFLYGPGAALRYGHRGGDGVLIIETRMGR